MRRRHAVLAGLAAASGDVSAHGSVQGLGTFFSGVVHPVFEPTHLIAMVAIGLVVGQRGFESSAPALLCFFAVTAAALLVAGMGWTAETDTLLLAVSALAGLLVAAAMRLPRAVYGLGAAILGAGIGLASRPDAASAGELVGALAGTALGVVAWTVNVVVVVQHMKQPWLLVLVRIFGSWTAAASVLVLALWLAGNRHEPPPPANGNATELFDLRR